MRRAVLAVTFLAGVALADIPPSDTSGCNGKAAGDSCKRDDGSAGACAKSTCSRNDYSNGPPPTQVQYECLRCGDAPAAPPAEKKSCAAVPGEELIALAALLKVRARRRTDTRPEVVRSV
jgi:hypothetical protein